MVRHRRCRFCQQPLPAELGPAARYCSRAHRQRAYEARQADLTEHLRRQIRALQRQLAGYERVLERVAADPACEPVVLAVLSDEITAGYARLLESRRRGTGSPAAKIT